MGDPKKQKRKYEKPFRPWDKKRISEEAEILKKYGLRRKREIYKAESILRNFRRQARKLAANMDEKEKKELIERMNKLGLVEKNASLDDVLSLGLENILERRLQTIVFKKNITTTLKQSRQFIVHGHIKVGETKIKWPSFLVPKKLENKISLEMGGKK